MTNNRNAWGSHNVDAIALVTTLLLLVRRICISIILPRGYSLEGAQLLSDATMARGRRGRLAVSRARSSLGSVSFYFYQPPVAVSAATKTSKCCSSKNLVWHWNDGVVGCGGETSRCCRTFESKIRRTRQLAAELVLVVTFQQRSLLSLALLGSHRNG